MRFFRRWSHDRAIVEDGPASLILVDDSGVILRASRAARAFLGPCAGRPLRDVLVLDDAAMARWLKGDPRLLWASLPSGGIVVASPARTRNGIVFDIAQIYPRLAGVRPGTPQWGLVDALTGVFNRAALNLWWDTVTSPSGWVLYVDICGLREINNNNGFQVGDQVIVVVAEKLASCVRSGLVFRVGGNEFVLVLLDVPAGDIRSRTEAISAAVRLPIQDAPSQRLETVTPEVSIGAARLGDELDDSLMRADKLMYSAKRVERPRIVVEGDDPRA